MLHAMIGHSCVTDPITTANKYRLEDVQKITVETGRMCDVLRDVQDLLWLLSDIDM